MDPISLLFSAYLDAVQRSVHTQLTDALGTDFKAVVSYRPTIARIGGVED